MIFRPAPAAKEAEPLADAVSGAADDERGRRRRALLAVSQRYEAPFEVYTSELAYPRPDGHMRFGEQPPALVGSESKHEEGASTDHGEEYLQPAAATGGGPLPGRAPGEMMASSWVANEYEVALDWAFGSCQCAARGAPAGDQSRPASLRLPHPLRRPRARRLARTQAVRLKQKDGLPPRGPSIAPSAPSSCCSRIRIERQRVNWRSTAYSLSW